MPQRMLSCSAPVRAPVFVELDPVSNQVTGMLQRFKPVPMHALLLEPMNHPLDQAILLETVRRDEFLTQAIASDQGREAAAGEDQPIVRSFQTVGSVPAPVLTPPSWISRRTTGASSAVPDRGNRSPGPSWSSHHVRPRPSTCRWPSAHSVPRPPRAGIGSRA